jgi:hypothetical protein
LFTISLREFVTERYSFSADFFTFWLATKEVWLEGGSPYSQKVTLQSQMGIYGRPAFPHEDQLAFAYPPYSLLVTLPTAWMDYPTAQAYWIAFNIILLFIALWYAFPRLPIWVAPLTLFFYPALRGVIIGQFAVTIGAFLIIAYGLFSNDQPLPRLRWFLAGSMLAWVTIKPQLSVVLLFLFLLYAIRHRMWSVLTGFALSLIGLTAFFWLLIPGWVFQWFERVVEYSRYVNLSSQTQQIVSMFLYGDWANISVTVIYILVLIIFVILSLVWWYGRLPFSILLSYSVLVILILHPTVSPSDLIILALPFLVWISEDDISLMNYLFISILVVIPWVVFLHMFTGYEPFVIGRVLSFIYIIWFIWLLFEKLRLNKKKVNIRFLTLHDRNSCNLD